MSAPTFLLGLSKTSKQRLSTVDKELREIIEEVAKYYPLTVITGFRSEEEQRQAFINRKTKLQWPHSKHNKYPSQAVDVAPIKWNKKLNKTFIDWEDTNGFSNLAGYILNEARHQNVHVRWGADWDMDTDITDEDFLDFVHFELIDG